MDIPATTDGHTSWRLACIRNKRTPLQAATHSVSEEAAQQKGERLTGPRSTFVRSLVVTCVVIRRTHCSNTHRVNIEIDVERR